MGWILDEMLRFTRLKRKKQRPVDWAAAHDLVTDSKTAEQARLAQYVESGPAAKDYSKVADTRRPTMPSLDGDSGTNVTGPAADRVVISEMPEVVDFMLGTGDVAGAAGVSRTIGWSHRNLEQHSEARTWFKKSHDLYVRVGDARTAAEVEKEIDALPH